MEWLLPGSSTWPHQAIRVPRWERSTAGLESSAAREGAGLPSSSPWDMLL